MSNDWDGRDRRSRSVDMEVVIYKVTEAEKKIEKLDNNFNTFVKDFIELRAELKTEIKNMVKNQSKTSGALWGIASAIIVTILGVIIKSTMDGK